MRRAVDVICAIAALVVLSPVLCAIALAVLIRDGAPVLYRQTRVGRNGRPFLILKFRSMQTGIAGASITADGDARVTPLGRWLRKFKLDELPQFWNVLRGEMSLIGPRPEVPDYVQFEDPVWREVLSAPPGITDLASLAFRGEEQLLSRDVDAESYYRLVILPAKLRLNVLYLRSRSLSADLRLLWMTMLYSFMPHKFDRSRVLGRLGGALEAREGHESST